MIKKSTKIFLFYLISLFFLSSCKYSILHNVTKYPQKKLGKLEINIFDIGQGDSFLVSSPSGKNILIDAGNIGKGYGAVYPYLKEHGIDNLDYIIATHYHSDHIGGITEVIKSIGGNAHIIRNVFDRDGEYISPIYDEYKLLVGGKRKSINPGDIIDLGDDVSLKCIASSGATLEGIAYSGIDENALSVVLILKYHSFDIYLGADTNSFIEPSLIPYARDVDVYKVSHHGSATSSTQQLLNCLKPEVSVISVGNGNAYGLPDVGILERLISMNSYIYQTEAGWAIPPVGKGEVANGNIMIETDGDIYTISGSSLITVTRLTDEKIAMLISNIYFDILALLSRVY